MPAEVRVFAGPEELGEQLADENLTAYEHDGNRQFLLGCPSGRSLRSTHRALARREPDLSRLVVVMMDEFVVDGAEPPADAHHSCRRFAREELAGPRGVGEKQVDEVPRHGVSVGLGTIADARSVRVVLHGSGKRPAAERPPALDRFDPEWPASIVHDCMDGEIWLDREAHP